MIRISNTEEKGAQMYTVGSLFAGIGGICKGFENAGFKLLWANEIDKKACITYKNNFSHNLIEGDIRDIDKLEKVDIVTAGFPCQPFSIAGYQKGFNDDRGNLFYEIMRVVRDIRPKVLFLENVKNLARHDNGNTLKMIKLNIENSNYSFNSFILNTKEHGNIPQNRERIFIVCLDLTMNINPEISFKPDKIELTKTIKDLLDNSKQEDKYYYNNTKYYEELKKAMINRDSVYQWRRQYVRENKSKVCPTLTANMGTGGHNVPLILDDYGIRKLTPRECLRFQGFEDNFIIPSDVSDSNIYKQIGNSVTISVVERVAKMIKYFF